MGRPRVIEREDLARKLRSGMSQKDIATDYGVSRSAVAQAVARFGLTRREHIRYDREIPWTVAREHDGSVIVRRLRTLARIDRGLPVSADSRRYAEQLAQWMRENQVVVQYTRDRGFAFVPAREGVDSGYIRKPDWLLELEAAEQRQVAG